MILLWILISFLRVYCTISTLYEKQIKNNFLSVEYLELAYENPYDQIDICMHILFLESIWHVAINVKLLYYL